MLELLESYSLPVMWRLRKQQEYLVPLVIDCDEKQGGREGKIKRKGIRHAASVTQGAGTPFIPVVCMNPLTKVEEEDEEDGVWSVSGKLKVMVDADEEDEEEGRPDNTGSR